MRQLQPRCGAGLGGPGRSRPSAILLTRALTLLFTSALLFSRALAVLAESDFQEDQKDGAAEAERDQHEREELADQAGDQRRAEPTDNRDSSGRPECQDPRARGHPAKVHRSHGRREVVLGAWAAVVLLAIAWLLRRKTA